MYQLDTAHFGDIAVTHLPASTSVEHKGSIVMVPGMFSNRGFWLSNKGIGLAAVLSQQGYHCWMMDRRGLGQSGKAKPEHHRLFHAFEYDLPAVQQLLAKHGHHKAIYMGHSFGGVLNGLSAANEHLSADGVAGLVNFSSQLTVGKTMLNKPYSAFIYALTAVLGHFPSKALKMGPENESKECMRDCCRLVEEAKGKNKTQFWQAFSNVTCPVLAFGSEGDTVDPLLGCQEFVEPMGSVDKTFVKLGKKYGYSKDFDHVGMVVSKDAQREVWPVLFEWLSKRSFV